MTQSAHTMFRPPAEAGSVLIRVADGCPHNACAFCAMYRSVPYRVHDRAEVEHDIKLAAGRHPGARRVFLADGDVLALPAPALQDILTQLGQIFPRLARVNCYASGQAMANKSEAQLRQLRRQGMHTLYVGLESGSDEVLRRMGKGGTVSDAVDGCIRARNAGLSVSVMVLVGIGGRELSATHVNQTAMALNAMQPDLLSCLRLIPVPDTPLARRIAAGRFIPLSQEESVLELRALLSKLRLKSTVFRADHSSNVLPLSGRLPRDRDRMLEELDELLQCQVLDKAGPGPMPAAL
jgi:radical SAM superfamily enzyme YgiQ (UPF0313 family)